MMKQEPIEALNRDISYEFARAIQYIDHATLSTGDRFKAIQKELLVHSTEEILHATTLADQVAFLGGKPTTGVGPIQISDDPEQILPQDLDGEREAVARYKRRIRLAMGLGEFGLARGLQDVRVMEE